MKNLIKIQKNILWSNFGFYLIFALILLWVAFENRFPLVTSDSGAYIGNGYSWDLPTDRPLTYSLFARATGMGFSTWGIVLVQSFLLGWLLIRLINWLHDDLKIDKFKLLAYGVAAVLLTSVSWYSSQIMPDIFSAILLISSILYIFETSKRVRIALAAIWFLAAMMHNSHLIAGFVFGVLICFWAWRKNLAWRTRARDLTALGAAALLTMATWHAARGYGFTLSRSSHVFLMGKLAENGILKKYLRENCNGQFRICEHIDKIPNTGWEFVWGDHSPLRLTGGWDTNRVEYKTIIRQTFSKPKYISLHIWKSLTATMRQLGQIEVGDGLFPMIENSNPYWNIEAHYAAELPEFRSARQQTNQLDWRWVNPIHIFFVFISSVFVLWHFGNADPRWRVAYALVLLFLVVNAWTVASFANVLGRLGGRVFWVLPFLNLVFIGSFLEKFIKKNS